MRMIASITFTILALLFAGCGKSSRTVIVYTSHDQFHAEPILAEFTKQTGIKILPVFDSESVKTAALAQRLIAEKQNPKADIFWSNEEMISRHLAQIGVLDSNAWAKAGYRTRRLVINTNLISAKAAPKSLSELTDPKWSGKIALAYPVYGTTASHFVALRQSWGDAVWKSWCESLAANKPLVVDGNSMVVRLVGKGEAAIGFTDSDDIAAGLRNGLPIAPLPVTCEFLSIPSSVAIVRGAPNASEAEAFFKYAQSEQTVNRLVAQNALESVHESSAACRLSQPAPVEETRDLLKTIFARK